MKRIVLILICLFGIFGQSNAQFSDRVNPFRVIVVSPNYNNTYPRFSTLQNAYSSIKDSATVSTGKYFIINVVTKFNNVTDFTSQWRDSILNRSPYMTLTAFGSAYNDSVVGVTTEEFLLVAGILSLNSLTAGNGLLFSNHQYSVLGDDPIFVQADSVRLRYDDSTLGLLDTRLILKRLTNGGINKGPNGVFLITRNPLKIDNDTLDLALSYYFTGNDDSLGIDWNTNHFDLIYGSSPAVNVKLDSGLTSSSNGLKVWLADAKLKFNSSKKLTLGNIDGTGLLIEGDSMIIRQSYQFANYDSLWIDFNTNEFDLVYGMSPAVNIKLDSGLTTSATGLKVTPDYSRINFNSSEKLTIPNSVAGDGIVWESNTLDIVSNEFAELENDTLKIKTTGVFTWWGDSLTTNLTVELYPYDSTGFSVFAGGKVKRTSVTYQLTSGNDTAVSQNNDVSFSVNDKLRLKWDNGTSRFTMQKWTLGSRTWTNLFNVTAIDFANNKWRFTAELLFEAQ